MERDEHRQQALALIEEVQKSFPQDRMRAVSEGCYTFSELNLFGGDISLDADDAIQIWALIETIRKSGFPDALRM